MIIKKHFLLILFIAIFLFPTGLRAANAIRSDTAGFQIRLPSAGNITDYHNQKAFNYVIKKANSNNQLIIWRWIIGKIGQFFILINEAGRFEWFLVIMIALAILSIVLKVNDVNPIALFRSKNQRLQPSFEIGKENIAGMDFPALIDQAERQQNYRLAIRYQYLQSLAMLELAGKIKLKDEKTNREYLREIGQGETGTLFARLVYGFEYIWYGEFLPDEKQYLQINSAFIVFQNSLKA